MWLVNILFFSTLRACHARAPEGTDRTRTSTNVYGRAYPCRLRGVPPKKKCSYEKLCSKKHEKITSMTIHTSICYGTFCFVHLGLCLLCSPVLISGLQTPARVGVHSGT